MANYPRLPRTKILNSQTPAEMGVDPLVVAEWSCSSIGGINADQGVLVQLQALTDPTAGADTVDFAIDGSVDGTHWEELDAAAETDFVAAEDPATVFIYNVLLPYRPAYRLRFVDVTGNAANEFSGWCVR